MEKSTKDASTQTPPEGIRPRSVGCPPSATWSWFTSDPDAQKVSGLTRCDHCSQLVRHRRHTPEDARRHLRDCAPFKELMAKIPDERQPTWFRNDESKGRPQCTAPGCERLVHRNHLCARHGEHKQCGKPGCERMATTGRKWCSGHSNRKKKLCDVTECTNQAQTRGVCKSHLYAKLAAEKAAASKT